MLYCFNFMIPKKIKYFVGKILFPGPLKRGHFLTIFHFIWRKWGLNISTTHFNSPWKLQNVLDDLKSLFTLFLVCKTMILRQFDVIFDNFYLCQRENLPFLQKNPYFCSFFGHF